MKCDVMLLLIADDDDESNTVIINNVNSLLQSTNLVYRL